MNANLTSRNGEDLPVGAVVDYTSPDGLDRARMVIVALSLGNARDPETLYFAAKQPIAPPPPEHKLYSRPYLAWALNAGWFVGNCDRHLLKDTGERVKVEKFDVHPYL